MSKLYELEEAINLADSIAFDGCHKIYLLNDEKQTNQMREYEYEHIITAAESNPYDMFEQVRTWYDNSCGLKFIYAVESVEDSDPEFYSIVSQMEDLYGNDEEEDEDEDWDEEEDEEDE